MVKGNFWCPAQYHQHSVAHIQAFADVYRETFEGLSPSESQSARHSQVIVHDRLVFEPAASVPSQEKRVSPHPWESLASLLARKRDACPEQRVAKRREPIEQLLWRRGPLPEDLLTLRHQGYYRSLGDALALDEVTLYTLTLHRFTTAFHPAQVARDAAPAPSFRSPIERPLLSQTTLQRVCLAPRITKICPACLKEEPVYERVYWNLKSVVLCPLHHCPLLDRCPGFHRLIPIFRPIPLSTCPYCSKDYCRTAPLPSVSPDSLLYKSQMVVLSMLGIHDKHELPSLFGQSPLEELFPWHYFALLDCFGAVLPALRPEKLLASLAHTPVLADTGLASLPEPIRSSAMHLCLFHALFVSWPQRISLILNAPDLQTAITMFSSGVQDDQHHPDACYLALLHILTSMRRRSDQEILLRQEKRALSEMSLVMAVE